MVVTPPWTRLQTWGTGGRARFGARVMDTSLTTGLLALVVASLVLGVARVSTKVLAIQSALARVPGVIYAFDESRSSLVDVQIALLTLPTSSLAFVGTATHGFVTQCGASDGGWILMASNLFRMLTERKLLLDQFPTFDGRQVLEEMAEYDRIQVYVIRVKRP